MRKLQSAALRTLVPGRRGLRHEQESRRRCRSVFLKASQILTCHWLTTTGTILTGKESKKLYHPYDFFLNVLKNKCYTQKKLLAHHAIKRIKLWGKHWRLQVVTHTCLGSDLLWTRAELRQSQWCLSPATI